MSWATELYNLYDTIVECNEPDLLPIYHLSVNAQIEVTIDEDGNFVSAAAIEDKKDRITIIPVTVASGGRSGSACAPHPFADKLAYIAGDYNTYCNINNSDKYGEYINQLKEWCDSEDTHIAVIALYKYLSKGSLISDLVARGVLAVDSSALLTNEKILGIEQLACFVRFIINYEDLSKERRTWLDTSLYSSHISHEDKSMLGWQLCYATAKETTCIYNHPSKLLNAGSKAKLFSANDESGYSYRGRFLNKEQAVSIGYEFSQKMHNALRWLIQKHGIIIEGSLGIVAWESYLNPVPRIDYDSMGFFGAGIDADLSNIELPKTFASYKNQLEKMIFSHKSELKSDSKIMVMVVDSSTTGRMSVNMYSELMSSVFYENLAKWHRDTAWHRYNSKTKQNYVGSFSLGKIAAYTYGTEQSNSVKCKAEIKREAYSRIIPCIIEGRKLPEDIVRQITSKACRPLAYEPYNWLSVLEAACGLIRKNKLDRGEECKMGLDKNNKSRSYLYGRLLAIAEVAEKSAYDIGEVRVTNALRYFETFSNRPYQTWGIIYNKLIPYLNKMGEGKRVYYTKMIDEVMCMFTGEEFKDNSKLDTEFLLAYSCQRSEIYRTKNDTNEEE